MTAPEDQWPPPTNDDAPDSEPELIPPLAQQEAPLLHATLHPSHPAPERYANFPEDLRVPWSWLHIIFFLIFGFGTLMVISIGLVGYFAGARHMKIPAVQILLTTNTPLVLGQQLLLFGALVFFLYVTIGVLRQVPFWRTIGWRPFAGRGVPPKIYFFLGCVLALGVGFASSHVQPKGPMPIQELFRDRMGTLLVMAFAVLIAPVVEETIFRGFLYPVLARSFGISSGIVVTGVLFGLLHGAQLGWTWGYVGVLTIVGIIFTFVRAQTGTVYASYLCHLGYNFMFFLGSAVSTKGFTQFKPPGT